MQAGLDDLAESVVVVDARDLRDFAQTLKSGVVEFVNMANMVVRQRRIWQRLHVAKPMGESRGQFQADIVGRTDKSRLCQGTTEECKLA